MSKEIKHVQTQLTVSEWKRLDDARRRANLPLRDFVGAAIMFYLNEIGA